MRRKIVAAGLACMLALSGCTNAAGEIDWWRSAGAALGAIVVGGLVYAASKQRGSNRGRFADCMSHYTGQQRYDCINRSYW
jgi:hypothetical protein